MSERDAILSELRSLLQVPYEREELVQVSRLYSLRRSIFWSSPWERLCKLLDRWPDEEIEVAVNFCKDRVLTWPAQYRYVSADWKKIERPDDPRFSLIGRLSYGTDYAEFLELLQDASRWPNVTELYLGGDLSATQIATLLQTPVAGQCTSLVVGYKTLDAAQIHAICDAPIVPQLTHLTLHRSELGPSGSKILAAGQWDSLIHLDLNHGFIEDPGLDALGESQTMPALTEYRLQENHLSNAALERFLSARSSVRNITMLDLEYNESHARGARAIAESPACDGLRYLRLSANEIGDEGLIALAESPGMHALEELLLKGNNSAPLISNKGMKALGASAHMAKLRWLAVGNNRFTWKGLKDVVNSPHTRALAVIDVSHTHGLDLSAQRGLSGIKPTGPLASLNLTYVSSSDKKKSASSLRRAKFPETMEWLDFFGVEFDAQMLESLVNNPTLEGLRYLGLYDTPAHDDIVDELLAMPLQQLEILKFQHYRVALTMEHVDAIIATRWFGRLKKLEASCATQEAKEKLAAACAERNITYYG